MERGELCSFKSEAGCVPAEAAHDETKIFPRGSVATASKIAPRGSMVALFLANILALKTQIIQLYVIFPIAPPHGRGG